MNNEYSDLVEDFDYDISLIPASVLEENPNLCIKALRVKPYRVSNIPKSILENYPEAMQWLQKASDNGHANAQLMLGFQYRDGIRIEKNMAKAYDLFEKSANQNNPVAQVVLGKIYQYGLFVPKDSKQAVEW